jgi:hypothetical protein
MSYRLTLQTPDYETSVYVRLSNYNILVTIFYREYTAIISNETIINNSKEIDLLTDFLSNMQVSIITGSAIILYNSIYNRYELTNGSQYIILNDVIEKELLMQITELLK